MDNAGSLTRSGDRWLAWFGTEYPPEKVLEAVHKNESQLRGWHLYTPQQLFTSLELATLLIQHYELQDVLGHDDVAPGRKTDPGPAFPMDTFRSRVFGRPEVTSAEPPPAPLFRTTTILNIRNGPGAHYETLNGGPLPEGTRMELIASDGSWRMVDVLDTVNGVMDLQGWVHGRYIEPIAN